MRRLFLPLSLAAAVLASALGGCSRPDPEQLRAEVLAADTAFSDRSAKDGPSAAFLAYVAGDAILLGQRARGPEGVRALYHGAVPFPSVASLTWKPMLADVAASGDLGYTWGRYELRLPAIGSQPALTRSGSYVTIWKKQPDGSWKFALDGGSPDGAPPPPPPAPSIPDPSP